MGEREEGQRPIDPFKGRLTLQGRGRAVGKGAAKVAFPLVTVQVRVRDPVEREYPFVRERVQLSPFLRDRGERRQFPAEMPTVTTEEGTVQFEPQREEFKRPL